MRKAEDYLIAVFNHVERQNSVLKVERRESLNIFLFFSKLVQAGLTVLEINSSQFKPLSCILAEFVNLELCVQGSAEHKLCCWHLSQGKLHWDSKLLYVSGKNTWVNTAWHWVQTSTPKVKRFPQPLGNKSSCLSEGRYSPGPERQSNTHAVNFHFKQWDSATWQRLGKTTMLIA